MAKFKIVTTGPGGTDHSLEMEALSALGAQIVEVGGGEDELVAAVADADAIYGKGRPRITAKVIGAGKKLKVVSLASVGVDSVDVDAATRADRETHTHTRTHTQKRSSSLLRMRR